jgi:tRNA (guanine-N7-)-methyltransferase
LFEKNYRFYGRRKGRKLTDSSISAFKEGKSYIIESTCFSVNPKKNLEDIFGIKSKKIILEIGFGAGDNIVNSAKMNPDNFHIGADPFLNTNAKCLKELLKNKIMNVKIWPDDIRKIIEFFPSNSISEIKILFPDPWPKTKHKNRRLIQIELLNFFYNILKLNGTITLATDHFIMKSWVLEIFQAHKGFFWKAEDPNDWKFRPINCYSTKYERKSYAENRNPSWFIFEKIS